MEKVGLITFHASYNFGSVMQAWALQHTVEELGYGCDIINFRMGAQKDKYSLFPLHGGIKLVIRNILQIAYIGQKWSSIRKYEAFITQRLHITEELNTMSETGSRMWDYDIYLAGSDQIWAHTIPEFVASQEDTRKAYYFSFVDGYKISYASSTGEATYEELMPYKSLIDNFSYIAVREGKGKDLIERLIGRKVETVLDPTYLISHEEWCRIAARFQNPSGKKYILIYSLQGRKKAKWWREAIRILYNKLGLDVVTVVPFSPINGEHIINRVDAGPEDILSLFANAAYILTDTFHGMSFAIHFRKQFVLLETGQADYRKKNILDKFNLMQRITYSAEECCGRITETIDYRLIESQITKEINHSREYLKEALEGHCR